MNHGPLLPQDFPSFSGKQEKTETGYDHWRSQFKSLIDDGTYTDSQILYAIHNSVKDTAGDVLLSMPEGFTPSDVLSRFDLYFGNVLSVDCLTENFHSSKQKPDETAVTWSCRLQRMLDLINKKDPMTRITYDRLHRSKFWNGLAIKDVKEATRHRFENGEDFDEIFAAVRALESQNLAEKKEFATSKKISTHSHQISTTPSNEASEQSKKLDKILQRLSLMETRLNKLEATSNNSSQIDVSKGKSFLQKSSQTSRDSNFCSRCKRTSHSLEKCHAKKDKHGKPLKN